MLVENLPINRSWTFQDNDDVMVTFVMKEAGVVIPLVGCTVFSQIREEDNSEGVLVSEGSCTISEGIITVSYPRADLANQVGQTLYGDIRIRTAEDKLLTLLKFSAAMEATISREVV